MSRAIWEFDMHSTEDLEKVDILVRELEELMPEIPIDKDFLYALRWEINQRELNKGKET